VILRTKMRYMTRTPQTRLWGTPPPPREVWHIRDACHAGNREWMEVLTGAFTDSKLVESPFKETTQALAYVLYDPSSCTLMVNNGGDSYIRAKERLIDWIEYRDQVSFPRPP